MPMPNNKNRQTKNKSIGHYILGKTIGEGTFGKVKLGTHILTGERVAVKVLEKERIVEVADVERVAREVHILKLIRHPHIVQLYEIIETKRQLYLIMEYASGGELFDYIVASGRVPDNEACRFFHQIIAGVEKVHAMHVVHRDLKPENLLLDDHKCIKIVDFGLSNIHTDGQLLKTACGSPCYAAPEMIAGHQYVPSLVDLWSCGVILFALVCGHLPFEDQNTAALYKKILAADYRPPKLVNDSVKELIAGLLTADPKHRFTIPSIRAHPWYRQIPESSILHSDWAPGKMALEEDVLQELDVFGFPRDYAVRCLEFNKHNHVTTTYYLLVEKKRRALGRVPQFTHSAGAAPLAGAGTAGPSAETHHASPSATGSHPPSARRPPALEGLQAIGHAADPPPAQPQPRGMPPEDSPLLFETVYPQGFDTCDTHRSHDGHIVYDGHSSEGHPTPTGAMRGRQQGRPGAGAGQDSNACGSRSPPGYPDAVPVSPHSAPWGTGQPKYSSQPCQPSTNPSSPSHHGQAAPLVVPTLSTPTHGNTHRPSEPPRRQSPARSVPSQTTGCTLEQIYGQVPLDITGSNPTPPPGAGSHSRPNTTTPGPLRQRIYAKEPLSGGGTPSSAKRSSAPTSSTAGAAYSARLPSTPRDMTRSTEGARRRGGGSAVEAPQSARARFGGRPPVPSQVPEVTPRVGPSLSVRGERPASRATSASPPVVMSMREPPARGSNTTANTARVAWNNTAPNGGRGSRHAPR